MPGQYRTRSSEWTNRGTQEVDTHKQPLSAHEEITFVDLISVLVRFRLMILVGTVVFVSVAVAIVYIVPVIGPESVRESSYVASVPLVVTAPPKAVDELVTMPLTSIAVSTLRDPVFLLPMYRSLRTATGNPLRGSDADAIDELTAEFVGRVFTVSAIESDSVLEPEESTILLELRSPDPDAATNFLDAVVSALPAGASKAISGRGRASLAVLDSARDLAERSLVRVAEATIAYSPGVDAAEAGRFLAQLDRIPGGTIDSLVKLHIAQSYLVELESQPELFIHAERVPFVGQSSGRSRDSMTTIILVGLAAFVAFVIVAFVRQYIENVAQNPAEMAKLKSAWRSRGKNE